MTTTNEELDRAIDTLRTIANAKRVQAAHHQACAVRSIDPHAKSYRLAANAAHTEAAELEEAVEILEKERTS